MRAVIQVRGLATVLINVINVVNVVAVVTVVATWLALCGSSCVRADEASGRWTGELEGRGNYYYEKSTRVNAPAGKLSLESPDGIRIHVDYLADIIASASVAQTGGASDKVFTELRHGIGAGVGKTFEVGDNALDLNARVIYSTESDYKSWIAGVYGSYALNDKDTTVSLGLTGVADRVYANMGSDTQYRGSLHGLTTTASVLQVMSPVWTLGLSYQFVVLDGFLGNPYRKALIGPLPAAEDPPDQRLRHNIEAMTSYYVPASRTAFELFLRFHDDDWHIAAITPELRVYQSLGRDFVIRARYRYYSQSKAYFALDNGVLRYDAGYTGPVTNDPKMSEFHSHQVGLRLTYTFNALRDTFLDFASRAMLDVSLDRQWCTSAFGNHWEGTLGGRIPF
jgi:hypothetical protein